jgi:peptidoglycan/xylan/chitin deacetylase (PgdA/CDA1 family)
MKFRQLYSIGLLFSFFLLQISCNKKNSNPLGHTQIEKWKDGKKSAVCITYDGGTANQFNVALPIMNLLHFPATFFIVTGEVEGSRNERKFIGRSLNEIVQETKDIPTNSDNFFERASAIRVLGDEKMLEYHTHTGDLWEVGKFNQAYHHIDEAYSIVRSAPGLPTFHSNQVKSSANWDEMKIYATQGHEFASHSISHAQFGILDEVNLVYELEKSKEEIMKQLGPKHIFSIECPYGTEDERVMKFTFARYEAARNRMPEPFLEEINRWNKMDIEGIGWEPIPGSTIEAYFNYIKSKEKDIWIATFQDVTKYIRERMQAEINFSNKSDKILIKLTHDLDPALYDLPLTLKTYVPETWMNVTVSQGEKSFSIRTEIDEDRHYVQYEAFPNADEIILTNGNNK